MRNRRKYLRTSQPHLCGQEPHLTHCRTRINTVWSTIWTIHGSVDLSLDILIVFMESLPLKFWLLLLPSLFQVIPAITSGIAYTLSACTKLVKKQTSSPHFTEAILHFLCLTAILTVTLLVVLYLKICNILGSPLSLLSRYYSGSTNTRNTDDSAGELRTPPLLQSLTEPGTISEVRPGWTCYTGAAALCVTLHLGKAAVHANAVTLKKILALWHQRRGKKKRRKKRGRHFQTIASMPTTANGIFS